MSDFVNKIVVLQDGKLTKVGPSDSLEISGGFTAGTLSGDGANVTNIDQANVFGLSSALSTLTTDVGTANSNASAAVTTANAAQSAASAAQTAATQAASDASSAASSASGAATSASNSASSAASAASDASAAAGSASSAAADASSAASSASGAATSASNAASSASSAASDASSAASSASSASIDASAAAAAALSAQGDASASASSAASAASDASAAAGSASSAATDASNAASSASSAASDASSAASSASAAAASAATAASDAATAITTANGAVTTANSAVTTANSAATSAASAVTTATSAATTASAAQTTADAALPKAGGTLTGAVSGTDLSLSGDLTVAGNIISKGQVDVIISDSFLDLNAGNVSSSATAGGLTVNVAKASGFTVETATAFVAGVSSVSAPSMTISGSLLAAGDIIQVSNSEGGKNDGLYVVAGVSGSTVTIKGIGGSMPSAQVPFVQNQLVAGSGETASVCKVDLAAMAVSNGSLIGTGGAIAAGLFCFSYVASATEGAFSGAWQIQASTGSATLQSAYDNGDGSIALDAGKPFHISGDADVQLDPHIVIGSAIGFVKSVAAGVAKGDLLFLDTDGICKKASSTAFSNALYVALENNNGVGAVTASKKVDFLGEIFVGITGTAPGITDDLFLSATAGLASKTAPVSGTIISLGAVVGAAVGGLYPVKFSPVVVASL